MLQSRTVAIIRLGAPEYARPMEVPAAQAIELILRRPHCWHGRLKGKNANPRIDSLHEIDPRPPVVWRPCYRNTSAPVLQPSVDWLASL